MRGAFLNLAIDGSACVAYFRLSTLVIDLLTEGCALHIVDVGATQGSKKFPTLILRK